MKLHAVEPSDDIDRCIRETRWRRRPSEVAPVLLGIGVEAVEAVRKAAARWDRALTASFAFDHETHVSEGELERRIGNAIADRCLEEPLFLVEA